MLVAEVASQGGRTTTVVVVVLAKCGFEHEDGRAQDGRLTRHKAELLPLPALLQLLPPQPRPATLTFRPVRPSVVYSISNYCNTKCLRNS